MNELLTISNVIELLLLVVAWSINRELGHIRQSIDDVKDIAKEADKNADKAHGRLDDLITSTKVSKLYN